jgi:hypothetical protein
MLSAETKPDRSWQEIAAEAAKEIDSQKLLVLAAELVGALEEHYKVPRLLRERTAKETIAQKPTVRPDNPQA